MAQVNFSDDYLVHVLFREVPYMWVPCQLKGFAPHIFVLCREVPYMWVPCQLKGFAPHILVLYREVPYILYIILYVIRYYSVQHLSKE